MEREKEGKRERLNEGGREGGRGLLLYSCLEDMAHTRLPDPTGNGEPRGNGKDKQGQRHEGGGGWRVVWGVL